MITDMAGNILYDSWDTGYLPLPGTNLKKYSYHKPQATFKNLSPPPEGLVILTSEGLLLPSVAESNSMDFAKDYSFLEGKGLSSKGTYAYQIPLPGDLRPDDIQDIKNFSRNNIYLLDNQGRVFVIGKNEHGQRGTSKDIPTSEWNQVEYPEPIKQIETLNVPGIFALSENENLYYHGYNEKGYL